MSLLLPGRAASDFAILELRFRGQHCAKYDTSTVALGVNLLAKEKKDVAHLSECSTGTVQSFELSLQTSRTFSHLHQITCLWLCVAHILSVSKVDLNYHLISRLLMGNLAQNLLTTFLVLSSQRTAICRSVFPFSSRVGVQVFVNQQNRKRTGHSATLPSFVFCHCIAILWTDTN